MHLTPPIPLVTLTTDFGTQDGYAGAMKGVIQKVAPHTRTIDLTHEISAGDIRAGAWALRTATPFFPRGSVHVGVIDPGVGTDRHAILVYADHQYYIGPDNGLYSWVIEEAGELRVWKLSEGAWSQQAQSQTFHGRDLFSHAAALLVREGDLEGIVGEEVKPKQASWAKALPAQQGAIGEIVHIDHFGNVITNFVMTESLPPDLQVQVQCGETIFKGLNRTYGDVEEGEGVLLIGSHDFLELAVRQGSASESFGLKVGDQVEILITPILTR